MSDRPDDPDGSKRLFLLDGHSLAYRAFFALPSSLATSTGQVTNAVYGFTSMLIKLLAEEKPDLVAVAFDTGAPMSNATAMRSGFSSPSSLISIEVKP